MLRLNRLIIGISAGLLIPGIIFFVLYYTKFTNLKFIEFPKQMLMGSLLPVVLSWCVLPNLFLFFIFNWINWLNAAKGLLYTTVVITILLFGLKILFH